jgi:uncharacterized membrane protein YhaH (DUF805 family)
MTSKQTSGRLLTIGALAFGAAVILRLLAGPRWFGLYGTAAIGLAVALPLMSTLMRGLEQRRRSRWLALLVVVPLVAMALLQIGYWMTFFSSVRSGITLGLGRLMMELNASAIWPVFLAVNTVAFAYVVWRSAGPIPRP